MINLLGPTFTLHLNNSSLQWVPSAFIYLGKEVILSLLILLRITIFIVGNDGTKFCAQSVTKEGKCECGVSSSDTAAKKPTPVTKPDK